MKKLLTHIRQLAGAIKLPDQPLQIEIPWTNMTIPLGWRSRPVVLRHGLAIGDPTPLYSMDPTALRGWFRGYDGSAERHQQMLYAETVYFRPPGMQAITDRGAVDVDRLRIQLEPTPYELPVALQPHGEAMVQFFKDSRRLRRLPPDNRWENNISARLVDFDPQTGQMTLQQATYFDQIATNLSVDTNSEKLPGRALTIRRDVEPPRDGRLLPLGDSALANTLGVAGILFARDGQPLLRERSHGLGSINAARIHCSVSGVYELPPDSRRGGVYGYDLLRYGIEHEIRQELNLEPQEYRLYPVALSRELPRHGKPQLFFAIFCDIPVTQIIQRLKQAEERYEYLNDPNFIFKVDAADHSTFDRFTYEGWAALKFALRFRSANQDLLGQGATSTRSW